MRIRKCTWWRRPPSDRSLWVEYNWYANLRSLDSPPLVKWIYFRWFKLAVWRHVFYWSIWARFIEAKRAEKRFDCEPSQIKFASNLIGILIASLEIFSQHRDTKNSLSGKLSQPDSLCSRLSRNVRARCLMSCVMHKYVTSVLCDNKSVAMGE